MRMHPSRTPRFTNILLSSGFETIQWTGHLSLSDTSVTPISLKKTSLPADGFDGKGNVL